MVDVTLELAQLDNSVLALKTKIASEQSITDQLADIKATLAALSATQALESDLQSIKAELDGTLAYVIQNDALKQAVSDIEVYIDQKLASLPIPVPVPTPTPTPVPVPVTSDGQKTWTMADLGTPDASGFYHLGSGPNAITVAINSSNVATAAITSFGLFCNETGQHIASGITVNRRSTSPGSIEGGFVFHGTYAPKSTFLMTKETTLENAYVKSFSLDGFPYECPVATASGQDTVSVSKWDNKNLALPWQPAGTAAAVTPVPVPTAANNLAPLFKNVTSGQIVSLPAGVIVGSTDVLQDCTVVGAGINQTIVDGTGVEPAGDKALFHTNTNLVTFTDMTIKNAKNPASMGTSNANAAGIKPELQTQSITLQRVKLVGNQNGLLCSGLTATDCTFDDNGCGEATKTHEIYNRGLLPMKLVNVTTLSTTDANHGHPVKSRSPDNYLENVNSVVSVNGGGHDFPDCGYVHIKGGSIKLKSGAADHKLIGYGGESATNKTAPNGNTMLIEGLAVDGQAVGGGIIQFGASAADAILQIGPGCTYTGTVAPIIKGLTNPATQVTGAFVKVG